MRSAAHRSDIRARRRGHHRLTSGLKLAGNPYDGFGAYSVLECVGLEQSLRTALSSARTGGVVGRVGAPQEEAIPEAVLTFYDNVTIAVGPSPARAYIEELLPDVLEGRIKPGRIFDRVVRLDGVPDGYRVMNDREAIKVLIEF